MPFVKGDANINREGRIPKLATTTDLKNATNRSNREKELMLLLKKLRPHISNAVMTAARIMDNDQATETSRLRAATILLENYRNITIDIYNPKNDSEEFDIDAIEQEDNRPTFSLKVINSESEESK